MIDIKDKENCCGCGACVQICPRKCISMHEDVEGFLYPSVDLSVCINCYLCERVCPVINTPASAEPHKIFAIINPDETQRMSSSSGGVFPRIALNTITNGGTVFGARFKDDFTKVFHSAARNEKELAPLLGSKYIQSEIADSFQLVSRILKANGSVLFAGTPCQIAGLKNYLGAKPYPKLLTVSILCHGVPSNKVWELYLKEITCKISEYSAERTHGIKDNSRVFVPEKISFRDKCNGWKNYCLFIKGHTNSETAELAGAEVVLRQTIRENRFMQGFLSNLYLRPSCHECHFRGERYFGDLTIGDLWGAGNISPALDDDFGTSIVIANTSAGVNALNGLNILAEISTGGLEIAKSFNGGLNRFAPPHPRRQQFFRRLQATKDIDKLIQKSLRPSILSRLRNRAIRYFRRIAILNHR